MKEIKMYKCDFCDYQTDDERECKKHEQEEHDSWAIKCVRSLRNYCSVKRRNNTCSKCQFFVNCKCYLESQIPEDWTMFMDFLK